MNLFRKRDSGGEQENATYLTKPTRFMGRIQFDTNSARVGIPPGVSIMVELKFTSNEFFMQCAPDVANQDSLNYKIHDLKLFVPVGEVNRDAWVDINKTWQREPIVLNIRKVTMEYQIINGGVTSFNRTFCTGSRLPVCNMLISSIIDFKNDYFRHE